MYWYSPLPQLVSHCNKIDFRPKLPIECANSRLTPKEGKRELEEKGSLLKGWHLEGTSLLPVGKRLWQRLLKSRWQAPRACYWNTGHRAQLSTHRDTAGAVASHRKSQERGWSETLHRAQCESCPPILLFSGTATQPRIWQPGREPLRDVHEVSDKKEIVHARSFPVFLLLPRLREFLPRPTSKPGMVLLC